MLLSEVINASDILAMFEPLLKIMYGVLIGIAILIILAAILLKLKGSNSKLAEILIRILADLTDNDKDSTADVHEYQRKYLLTKYEWINYIGMREYAAGKGLIICPKIRLADLVEPKKGKSKSEWQKLFNRIKAKHVDFVLCDQDMHIKLIVELDDSTHGREDRQERDTFVDAVLTGAGYKIVHIAKFDDAGIAAINDIISMQEKK